VRIVIVGLGVQGRKRAKIAGTDLVATVDPVVSDADHRSLSELEAQSYDAAALCVPVSEKIPLIRELVSEGKHVLVEKPLVGSEQVTLSELEKYALDAGVVVYTAYNHRFEPNIVHARQLLAERIIGDVYRISIYYGNGTARLVRDSAWRDQGSGVLHDLGSHVIDMFHEWCVRPSDDYEAVAISTFENRAPDHVVFQAKGHHPKLFGELSLLSWRNSFRAEIVGSSGTLHIDGLAKWGESVLTLRRRVLPSGVPEETVWRIPQGDPTWQAEYEHFGALCTGVATTDFSRDILVEGALRRIHGDLTTEPRDGTLS
jgi:predicted dehydrogenase